MKYLPSNKEVVRRAAVWNRALCVGLLGTILALPSSNLSAIEMPTLYTVEVRLDSSDDDPRAGAYERGLREILVRMTGSELPAGSALLDEWFPNPARYVLQFRQGSDDTLRISFDGTAIERQLRNAGQMVWGADRPLTLVWLAVDWGQGVREIVAADDPERVAGASRSIDRNRLLRERVQQTAARRGIPVAFPLLDSEDLQNISFADVWGGFDEQLLQASRRYQANSILVGRVRAGAVQRNRWTYYFGGSQQEWSGEPELAVKMLADVLAAEFAFAGNAPPATVTLNIAGIDSLGAYGSVQRFLDNLSLVEDFAVHSVQGDEIRYQVHLRGDAARFRRALELGNILIPVERAGEGVPDGRIAEADSLDFVYRAPARNF